VLPGENVTPEALALVLAVEAQSWREVVDVAAYPRPYPLAGLRHRWDRNPLHVEVLADGEGDIMVVNAAPLTPTLLTLVERHVHLVMLGPLIGIDDHAMSTHVVLRTWWWREVAEEVHWQWRRSS
jgi:hypothetical protein